MTSFILSPDEAWRSNARCPRPHCRITDGHLVPAYNSAARMGRIGNSLSHLMFGLSQSLQTIEGDSTFEFKSRELGRLMSTLAQARHKMWLAHSPLSEACRRSLGDLRVVPGQLFGSAARETLEHRIQWNKTRQDLAALRRAPLSQLRQGASGRYPTLAQPLAHSGTTYRSQLDRS